MTDTKRKDFRISRMPENLLTKVKETAASDLRSPSMMAIVLMKEAIEAREQQKAA